MRERVDKMKGKGGVLETLASAVGELLSPTRCAACERPGSLICDRCLEKLEFIDPAGACVHCGAPFGSMLCTECVATEGMLGRCVAAVVFDEAAGRIVRAYKDAGERRLAVEIAAVMADAARTAEDVDPGRYSGILSQVDAVTFVPATAAAYRRRGFDQMEQVARAFTELTGTECLDSLAKLGHADQRELTRAERLEHAQGVYRAVVPVRGKRLLLLDDVITTGATLTAASEVLRRAGAARVDALAFARVWG